MMSDSLYMGILEAERLLTLKAKEALNTKYEEYSRFINFQLASASTFISTLNLH